MKNYYIFFGPWSLKPRPGLSYGRAAHLGVGDDPYPALWGLGSCLQMGPRPQSCNISVPKFLRSGGVTANYPELEAEHQWALLVYSTHLISLSPSFWIT